MRKKSTRICLILPLLLFSVSCASRSGIVKRAHSGTQIENQVETPLTSGGYEYGSSDRKGGIASNDMARNPESPLVAEESLLKMEPQGQGEVSQAGVNEDTIIESELRRLMREFGEDSGEVPPVFLQEVRGYVRLYQTDARYREFFNASLARSSKYMPMVKELLRERGIPEDMAYIAFIESGFNPSARSRAGAVGMWQFMPKTARDYALVVNRRNDEREDAVRSTYAAAEYFQDLLAIFGSRSFLLAMAAYNSGEGRVISCLKQIDDPMVQRNFWDVRSCLAQETREYPPKIIAAAIVGNHPEAFGFTGYKPDKNEVLTVRAMIEKARVQHEPVKPAETISGSATEKKKSVNRSAANEIEEKPLALRIRKGGSISLIAEAFEVRSSDLRQWNGLPGETIYAGQTLKIYPKTPLEKVRYRVRNGDTVSGIAESFNIRKGMILVCNSIPDRKSIQWGQVLTFYAKTKKEPFTYTVKRGTNLTYISRAYRVSVEDIIKWNNLRSTTVYPGQRLKIYSEGERSI